MGAPTQDFLSSLALLLQTGKYSDLTILGETQRYNVHKAIVCPRSEFFDAACSGHFMESYTGEIDMRDEEEDLIEHMLSYFYHLDYLMDVEAHARGKATYASPPCATRGSKLDFSLIEDPLMAIAATSGFKQAVVIPTFESPPTGKRTPSPRRQRSRASSRAMTPPQLPFYEDHDDVEDEEFTESDLVTHARVYAVAEKYGIPGLKALAQKKFETQVVARWNDVDFLDAMEEVYTTTVESDRGLRNVVIQVFRAHPQLARRQETKAIIQDIPPFAHDLHRLRLIATAF